MLELITLGLLVEKFDSEIHFRDLQHSTMDSVLPIAILSAIIGIVIAFLVFGNYFQKRKAEVESVAKPETIQTNQKTSKPQQSHKNTSKKSQPKSHSHTTDHKVKLTAYIYDYYFSFFLF